MKYPEIREFESNPNLAGLAELKRDVVYSAAGGEKTKMTLILPWGASAPEHPKYPLVVFVQGSAWTSPNTDYEIPQLSQLAREGYVVATITHRSSLDGAAFPAYLVDTKTAIRFLRVHADEYAIDPKRVCVYGTSSGGNTALLVGVTGDDPAFKSDEYADFSDAVSCVAECFGPTDLTEMIDVREAKPDSEGAAIFNGLVGGGEIQDVLRRMSPVNYVRDGKAYPPTLIIHGDADPVVPYEQGTLMFHRLVDAGAAVEMIRVKGAPHEGPFWSPALVDAIFAFIKSHL